MKRNRKTETGYALIMALMLMVVVAGYLVTLHTIAAAGMRSSEFSARKVVADYMAEGGVEAAQKEMQRALADYQPVPAQCSFNIGGAAVSVVIQQISAQRVEENAQGIRTIIQPYLITSSVTYQGTFSSVERVVDVGLTPVFQYAVFYSNDLEILPGPSFTLTGRVHTNRNLYIGSHDTLTVDSNYLRAVGNIYLRRKDDGTLMNGSVTVRVNGGGFCGLERAADLLLWGIPSVSGFDSDFRGWDVNSDGDTADPGELAGWVNRSQALWNGTVKTGEHGLREIVAPSLKTMMPWVPENYEAFSALPEQALATLGWLEGTPDTVKGFYHANAGLVIRKNKAYVGQTEVTSSLPCGTINEVTMYDAREGKTVTVTEIDIAKLNSSGYFPANGLIYAYRTDATSDNPRGIRLKNGSTLAAKLTLVSPNPVYVRGDFNTVNKKPAAIIADALNILSNAWNNTKTPGTLPMASETTVNAAIITGNTQTTPGSYNGGLENLPRFHENWNNVTCRIRGSFVNIFNSQFAKKPWVYGGDKYTAPNRNWDYDTMFNDFDNLPPFTPYVVTISRVVQTNN